MLSSDGKRLKNLALIAGAGFLMGFALQRKPLMLSDNGIKMLKAWEGFRKMPYRDIAGHWTVGYGTRISSTKAKTLTEKGGIDEAEAERLMLNHVNTDSALLQLSRHHFPTRINDAVLITTYNIGHAAMLKSNAWQQLTHNNVVGALAEWTWYYYTDPETGQKKISEGLKARRHAEYILLFTGSYSGPDGETWR